MALDKRGWLRQLGVTSIAAAGAVQPTGAADGKAPVITVKSNGDGTFTIDGSGFLAKSGVLISAADRALDRAYGIAEADANGNFTFTTRNICPSPPPITFTATSGINSKTDRTDWVWSNTVATVCPPDKGSDGSDGTDGGADGSDGAGSDGGGADGGSDGSSDASSIAPSGHVGSDGSDGSGGGGDGATPPTGALSATATDLFFELDSADLTAADTASLDAYAQAMLAAGGSDAIRADGYASVDGDVRHNTQLAVARAQAVVNYLVGKGIPAKRTKAAGHGPTDTFSKRDPTANRRVTLNPAPPMPPPSQPATPSVVQPTTPPASPGIPQLTPDQLKNIIGDDTSVSHDQLKRELTDFLRQLQRAQGGKSLKIDDKVRLAGSALSKGLGNSELQVYSLLQDDRFNVVPEELAEKITKLLPDRIPRENFDNFLKLKPQPIKPPEQVSLSGAIAKLLTPAVKEVISGLPKDIRDKIVKGIQDAVEKGIVGIVDQAMSDSKLDDETKKAIHSAVEAAIKEKPGQPPDKQQP